MIQRACIEPGLKMSIEHRLSQALFRCHGTSLHQRGNIGIKTSTKHIVEIAILLHITKILPCSECLIKVMFDLIAE